MRTVVGYTGEGRHRVPVYADRGPASASTPSSQVAALGALSATGLVGVGERLTGGAGPVERRQVTEAERAARVRDDTPPEPWKSPGVTVTRQPAPQKPQEAVMPADGTDRRPTVFARLAEAAARADEALQRKTAADVAWLIAQREVRQAYLALAHLEPFAAEAVVVPAEPVQPPPEPAPAPRLTNNERMAQSRKNGQASMRKVVAKGTTGQKRTPEQRERMRQGQLAAVARRKAAAEAEAVSV